MHLNKSILNQDDGSRTRYWKCLVCGATANNTEPGTPVDLGKAAQIAARERRR